MELRADPALTKEANPRDARVGDLIEFTLTVRNAGSASAQDVVVIDPVPSFLKVVNATTTHGVVNVEKNTATVMIGTLSPNDMVVIRITTRVVAGVLAPDNRNVAYLSTSSGGNQQHNDVSVASVAIQQHETVTQLPTRTPPAISVPTDTAIDTPSMLPSTGTDDALLLPTLSGLVAAIVVLALGTMLVYVARTRRC